MISVEEAKRIKVANVMCRQSFLFHVGYFFLKVNKAQFVLNDHHEKIAEVIELILRGLLIKVIINMPPRYGKTELAVVNFVSHALSLNSTARFIHLSYSHDLVRTNSSNIKRIMKSDDYKTLFPSVRINPKQDSEKKWNTTDGGQFYATSTGGQVTGFGAGKVDDPKSISISEKRRLEAIKQIQEQQEIDKAFDEIIEILNEWDKEGVAGKEGFNGAMIIDDAIKPEDADSEAKRVRVNQRYDTTLKNRLNSWRTPQIIIGQRTHLLDLPGHVMQTDGFTTNIEEAIANPDKWFLLSLPAIVDEFLPTEHALWEFKHTLDFLKKLQIAEPISFGRQYQQNPQPKEGYMYSNFRTYKDKTTIPLTLKSLRKNYTDTADTGKDYLCSICYQETEHAMYITDVVYTSEKMETTEPMCALQLAKQKTQMARFESNNGGRSFARAVEKQTREIKNLDTEFTWFHQSNNKHVRIFNNSAKVTNMIYMPEDWATRWPAFYSAVTTYLKSGKNGFDDAPDCLTGMVEFFGKDLLSGTDPAALSIFG